MTIPALIRSPLVLWANSSSNQLQDEWQSNGNLDSVRLTQGDTVAVELHWLKNVATTGLIHDEVAWPAAANITLAIGLIDAAPEAGVFALSYGGQVTADIPFDADGAEVAAALNALSSVIAEGGVTAVQKANTYKVVWNNAGVLASSLAVATNDLLPASSIGTHLARAGAVNVAAIYTVHVKQSPVAVCNTWENAEPTELTLTLESTINGVRTWVLNFSKLPRGGSFTINYVWATGGKLGTTTAIEVDSLDATNIKAAFVKGSNWNNLWWVDSAKRSPLEYTISIWIATYPPSAAVVSSMSIANQNIIDFSTKVGLLSLNTMEVEALLAGRSSVDAVMEVEVEVAGERLTIVQAQTYIVNDLIDTDVYELVQFGDVIPADSVVRYDTSQSLTTGQKLQARNNIGALGASSLDALVAKDAELELLISGGSLTTDELEAIQGAATPSATNLFLTQSAADALYALLSHQHLPADIVGLQSTLDSQNTNIGLLAIDIANLQSTKANVYHTQPTSTITGLDTILAGYDTRINGFAAFNHTHTTLQVDGLEGRLATLELFQTNKEVNVPTAGQKAALDYANAPSDTNPLVTESRAATLLANNISGFATQVYVNLQLNAAISLLPEQYLSLGIETPTGASTNLTNTYFPLEILITQNGVSYYVPARLA